MLPIVINGQLISNTSQQLQPVLDQGLAGWVLRKRQPVLISDTSGDERWLRRDDDDRLKTGPKSAICIPLMAGEQMVGVLTLVHSIPNFFKQDHLELLQAIADQAGVAISNALLYDTLQTATRRYRELFAENINPLILTTWDGRILEANHAASSATGFTLTELTDQTIERLEPLSLKMVHEKEEDLHNGAVIFFEGEFIGKGEKKFPVEIFVVCTNLNEQECLQWTIRDITEKRELDHLRDDLTSMIFHDLRAPLANIVSSLDILKMLIEQQEMETIWPVFDIAHRSAGRLQRLTDSLLDINRLEAGQEIVNKKAANLYTLVKEAVEVVEPTIESRKQKISISLQESLPAVFIDAEIILRVMINLLENAAKFTPVGGELAIGFSHGAGLVTIWVYDSGPGIPQEEQSRIFEKFGRVRSDRFIKGVGLGLAFCRLAVQAHGGRIWVESGENSGTRFVFELPMNIG